MNFRKKKRQGLMQTYTRAGERARTFRFLASWSALFSSKNFITSMPELAAATCIPVFPCRSVDSTSSPRSILICNLSMSPSAQAFTKYSRYTASLRKENEEAGRCL